MKLIYIATLAISLLIILVEALWLFVFVRYGFIEDGEVSSYIPVLIVAFFVPFLMGGILSGLLLMVSSRSFRKKRFYTSVNWIALLITLLGLAVIAVKKVPVQNKMIGEVSVETNKDVDAITEKEPPKILSKSEAVKGALQAKTIAETTKEVVVIVGKKVSKVSPEPEALFKTMKNSCFKSHSPNDGFNQVQMLAYCECVVDDAKSSMSLSEIKTITKSLGSSKTSGEALLENDVMVGIVVECIAKITAK